MRDRGRRYGCPHLDDWLFDDRRGEDTMAIERIGRMERHAIDEIDERILAQHYGLDVDDEWSGGDVADLRRAVAAALQRAERVIEGEPDQAMWLLGEALRRLIELWLSRYGQEPRHGLRLEDGALDGVEDVIEWADPHVGRQLRLARCAGDARARLRHCWAMLALVERGDVGLEPADAGCGALRFEAEHGRRASNQQSEDGD
jgi:hypothetical protein